MAAELFLPRAVVRLALLLRGSRRIFRSDRRSRDARLRGALRPARYGPPARLLSRVEVSVAQSGHGWPVYSVQAATGATALVDVIYLHGGAYIQEITPTHWRFIEQLAVRTGARVIVPIYPLAPLATASQTVPRMAELVASVAEADPRRGLVVIGDSAGGGMALAVAQCLRDAGRRQPGGRHPDLLVLISPWLDVTVRDPRSREIEPSDPMLAIAGLRDAGIAYAGELERTDPRVSPLHGDLSELPPVLCFTGGADVLHPDALALAKKLHVDGNAGAVDLELVESEFHVYPLLPTRAGALARARIFRHVEAVASRHRPLV